MLTLTAISFIFDSLALALAVTFLFVVLWHDSRKTLIRFFAIFLFLVIVWDAGSLLLHVTLFAMDGSTLANWAAGMIEGGFAGGSVGLYILTTAIVGVHSRRFRAMVFASLLLVVIYRLSLVAYGAVPFTVEEGKILAYQLQPLFVGFFLVFDSLTLYWLWRFRRKIRSRGLKTGMVIFVLGQSLIFVNPALVVASLSTSISFAGVLVMSMSIVRQEIITPLSERSSQIEAMHKVSLAVSSQIALGTVLEEIAVQAAGWLSADGVGIFLVDSEAQGDNGMLRLATVHGLPKQVLNLKMPVGNGVAGTAAKSRSTVFLENYGRDWLGIDDFVYARETFGSVIATPLIEAGTIMGVLMVIASRQGHLFDNHDVYLLELLSAQAAVAISHSQLFEAQQRLTQQVEAGRIQLETVLTSTDNPVIAVDRGLRLIFANPAARSLFLFKDGHCITESLPRDVFPSSTRDVIRDIRQKGGHVYEISIDDREFLCHLAALGESRIAGWVVVLNDVSQLKELDRFRSEMVRMASHDLKNPLMGAMAYLDLLRDDVVDIGLVGVEEVIKTIERQHDRMNRIIRGILDIERIRAESLSEEICFVDTLVATAIAELETFIAEKGVVMVVQVEEDLPGFVGDREQFVRVLVNLIENAVKFTLNEEVVEVIVSRSNDELVFRIRDNGVGIPKAIQPRVFDRFFRGQQKSVEHVTGSGLGLNLVKTIVENHNGRIWLESEENRGTTFFVAVPIARD